jgi:hypothetical protein
MRKLMWAAALVLAVPAVALGAKPPHPTTPASTQASPTATTAGPSHVAKPTVMWVLRGTLSKYAAASATSNGSITITVLSSNHNPRTLKGLTLTFVTDSKTKVVMHTDKQIADGDRGIVKLRAVKDASATALQAQTAFQVVDQGASR